MTNDDFVIFDCGKRGRRNTSLEFWGVMIGDGNSELFAAYLPMKEAGYQI
ncbi:MAG TPA: hypothetical protein PKB02_17260 [Anaerohalosphaeraceae bacterium]|nr:hypothetical protein [Anaerohalosphaeraceae bacterium]